MIRIALFVLTLLGFLACQGNPTATPQAEEDLGLWSDWQIRGDSLIMRGVTRGDLNQLFPTGAALVITGFWGQPWLADLVPLRQSLDPLIRRGACLTTPRLERDGYGCFAWTLTTMAKVPQP